MIFASIRTNTALESCYATIMALKTKPVEDLLRTLTLMNRVQGWGLIARALSYSVKSLPMGANMANIHVLSVILHGY